MKAFKEDFIALYRTDRIAIIIMAFNLLLAIGLAIFSIVNLNPNAAVVKTGYGDIGGYRDGSWFDLIAFPLLAITFGVLHGFLALRVFHKRGNVMTKFFLLVTTALTLGTILVLIRLLGEG